MIEAISEDHNALNVMRHPNDSSEENGIKKPTAPQHRPRSRPNRGINSPPPTESAERWH
uniref:Transposase n=1 Tax=Ascaris lumbricoides TaxID=6252 RepID=A0A0M3IC10_ASCLU